jgi:hypothetical protein
MILQFSIRRKGWFSMMIFTIPDHLLKLEELGRLGMPLRHALLAIGVKEADLDEAMRDGTACAAHRTGALRLAKEMTTAQTREALAGNVSAAKLLMNHQRQTEERESRWPDDLATEKLWAAVDVVRSVNELFERTRMLHEEERTPTEIIEI